MKRVLISLLIMLGIIFIPFLLMSFELFSFIAACIHWPIFAMGFFGESGGASFILFTIGWYGLIIGLGTFAISQLILVLTIKNNEQ